MLKNFLKKNEHIELKGKEILVKLPQLTICINIKGDDNNYIFEYRFKIKLNDNFVEHLKKTSTITVKNNKILRIIIINNDNNFDEKLNSFINICFDIENGGGRIIR